MRVDPIQLETARLIVSTLANKSDKSVEESAAYKRALSILESTLPHSAEPKPQSSGIEYL